MTTRKKFIIIIDGPMGSGKTTIAKLLHGKIKRTAHIGLDRIKWFISDFKRIPEDNEIVRNVVLAMAKEYLKHGVSVIVEQGMRKERVEAFRRMAKRRGIPCFVYQLTAPKELLLKRVHDRPKLPDKPKISEARIERNYRAYMQQHKHPIGILIDTEKLSAKQVAARIMKDLS